MADTKTKPKVVTLYVRDKAFGPYSRGNPFAELDAKTNDLVKNGYDPLGTIHQISLSVCLSGESDCDQYCRHTYLIREMILKS